MNNLESKEISYTSIEVASPDDAEAIAHIQKETWLATYPNEEYGITEDDIKSKEFTSEKRILGWKERFENPSKDIQTFVVKEGNDVVGFCTLSKGEIENIVRALYLLPSAQGKGLGKELLMKGLQWLGSEKDISLHVAKYNSGAIDFYSKCGFEIDETDVSGSGTQLSSGAVIPVIRMIKKNIK